MDAFDGCYIPRKTYYRKIKNLLFTLGTLVEEGDVQGVRKMNAGNDGKKKAVKKARMDGGPVSMDAALDEIFIEDVGKDIEDVVFVWI
jgi:hypothetical protein